MNELQDKVDKLEKEVADLKAMLMEIRTNKGVREFVDNDFVVLRNLYAEKLYTKRSGSYVELTT